MKFKGKKAGRKIRKQGENPRDQIIESFLKICYEEGPDQVTLQKLAQHSGMTLANVRYYFAGKDVVLYHAALEYLLQKAYRQIEQHISQQRSSPTFNPIQAYIEVMLSWFEQSAVYSSFLIYFYYLCTTQVKTPLSNNVFLNLARSRIQGLIYEGMGKGLYKFNGNIEDIVLKAHAAVMGACVIAATQKTPQAALEQKKICEKLVLGNLLNCEGYSDSSTTV